MILELNGKTFKLPVASFRTLKAIEEALGEDIVTIQGKTFDLGLTQFAKLLSAALNVSEEFAGQAILDLGVTSDAYAKLRMQVMGWLLVSLSPPELREQRTQEMGEVIARASAASPGATTAGSASAS